MSRTPEERNADEALTTEVDRVVRTYSPELDLGILTDYVVIAAFQGFDADGEDETYVTLHPRDGNLPIYRIMGLLDYSQAHERGIVAAAEPVDGPDE